MGDAVYPYTPYIFMKLFIFKECCDNNCIILYLIVKPSEYDTSSTRKVSNMMHAWIPETQKRIYRCLSLVTQVHLKDCKRKPIYLVQRTSCLNC